MVDFDLKYAVIQLHDIARLLENKLGVGDLSREVRQCADRLEVLNSRTYHAEECGK